MKYNGNVAAESLSTATFAAEDAFVPGPCLDANVSQGDLMTRLTTNEVQLKIGNNGLVAGKRYVFKVTVSEGTRTATEAICMNTISEDHGTLTIV
jgi:hypothetical protein